MGVDISVYRARIGGFYLCTRNARKSTQVRKVELTSSLWRCLSLVGVNASTLSLLTILFWAIIEMLLLLGGVERNPGPGSRDTKKSRSSDALRKDDQQTQAERINLNIIGGIKQQVTSPVSQKFNKSINTTQFQSQSDSSDSECEYRTCSEESEDERFYDTASTNSTQSHEETYLKTYNETSLDLDPNQCPLIQENVEMLGTNSSELENKTLATSSRQTETVEFPLLEMVSQQSGCGSEIAPSSARTQTVAVIQEVFNTANIQNTAVNINLDLSNNQGPVQFGQTNFIGPNKESESESDGEIEQKINPVENYLREVTQEMIKQQSKKIFVHRQGVDSVIRKLKDFSMAVITGIPGEGKTSIAVEVMRQVEKGTAKGLKKKTPIKIEKCSEWKSIITKNSSYIVLIDDIFGNVNFNRMLYDDWEQTLNTIRMCVKSCNVYLLVTLRKNIFNQVCKNLGKTKQGIFANKYRVDLSSKYVLTSSEKDEIVDRYLEYHGKKWHLLPWFHSDEILREQTAVGFPFLCYMFFKDEHLFSKGKEFFLKANELLLDQVNCMYYSKTEKPKYLALVYTWLNDKSHTMNLNDFDPFISEETEQYTQKCKWLRKIASACGVSETNALPTVLKESAESLCDIYLNFNPVTGVFAFLHTSIMEAVCLSFGKRFPSMVLTYCDDAFILDFVTTKENSFHDNEMNLYIGENYFRILADRVFSIMQTNYYILNAKFMRDRKFISYFLKYKSMTSQELTLLVDGAYNSGNYYLIQCSYENGAKCSLRILLEIARGHFAKIDLIPILFKGRTPEEMSEALQEACLSGNKSIAKWLVEIGSTLTLDQMTKSLGRYDKKYYDMLKFLTGIGVILTTDQISCILKNAIRSDFLDIVKYFHKNGKTLKADQIRLVLHKAISLGCLDVVEYFYKPEYFLTPEMTLSSIDKAIQGNHLRTIQYLHSRGIQFTDEQIKIISQSSLKTRSFEVIKYFHESGISYTHQELQSVFDEAIRRGNRDIVEYLYEKNIVLMTENSKSCLFKSFSKGHVEVISYFHEKDICLTNDQMAVAINAVPTKFCVQAVSFFLDNVRPLEVEQITKLIEIACDKGRVQMLKVLNEKIINIFFMSARLVGTVQNALKKGKLGIAKFLIKNGVNMTGQQRDMALDTACQKQQLHIVKYLLGIGAELKHDKVKSLLESACRSGRCNIVQYLHQRHRVNLTREQKAGVLNKASEMGNVDFIQYFREHISPLSKIQEIKILNTACVKGYTKVLSYMHCNVSPLTSEQMKQVLDSASSSGKFELLKFLHYNKVPLTSEQMSGFVDAVCSRRKNHMVKYLHEKGVDLTPSQYTSVLLCACNRGTCEIVEYLHQNVRPLTSENLQMALDVACSKGKLSLIRFCHEKGAVLTSRQLKEASNKASDSKNLKMIRYLHEHGAVFTSLQMGNALYEACICGKLYMAKYFHQNGAQMTMEEITNVTNHAISNDHLHILKYTLEIGMPFTSLQITKSLLVACSKGNLGMVKCFYENGTNFTKETMTKCIDIALKRQHFAIIKYLHKQGADVSPEQKLKYVKDAFKSHIKHLHILKFLHEVGAIFTSEQLIQIVVLACKRGNIDMLKYFHQSGVSLKSEVISHSFETVLNRRHFEILSYLNKHGAISISQKTELLEKTSIDEEYCDLDKIKPLHEIGTPLTPAQIDIAAAYACRNGNTDMVKYFCENGAVLTQRTVSLSIETATRRLDFSVINYLNEIGVDFPLASVTKALVMAYNKRNQEMITFFSLKALSCLFLEFQITDSRTQKPSYAS